MVNPASPSTDAQRGELAAPEAVPSPRAMPVGSVMQVAGTIEPPPLPPAARSTAPVVPTARPLGARDLLQRAITHLTAAMASLPKPRSAAFKELCDRAKADFAVTGGQGFMQMAVADYFPEAATQALLAALPKPGQVDVLQGLVLLPDGQTVPIAAALTKVFTTFTRWLGGVLSVALGAAGPLRATTVQLRQASGTHQESDGVLVFDRWHVDGGDLSAIIPLVGRGPLLLENAPKLDHHSPEAEWQPVWDRTDGSEISRGEALIISGTDRSQRHPTVRATVHKSPPLGDDRLLLIIRFADSGT